MIMYDMKDKVKTQKIMDNFLFVCGMLLVIGSICFMLSSCAALHRPDRPCHEVCYDNTSYSSERSSCGCYVLPYRSYEEPQSLPPLPKKDFVGFKGFQPGGVAQ